MKRIGIIFALFVAAFLYTGRQPIKALFSQLASSETLQFFTGRSDILIDNVQADSFSNWLPGDKRSLFFSVQNNGDYDVSYELEMDGEWSDSSLSNQAFFIERVYVYRDNQWIVVTSNKTMGESFAPYINNGDITLARGQTEEYRFDIVLPEETENEYQDSTFDAVISVDALQI